MTRVLIVDDDVETARALSRQLSRRGFDPEIAVDRRGALARFDLAPANIVLLDLLLPGLDGLQVCRELRARGRVPIIMVTGRDGEIDKIVGLEVGADDYVTKPYSIRELIARMDAVLRRRVVGERAEDTVLTAGPTRMNVDRHRVTVGGREVALPLREFELLEVLLRAAGRVVCRSALMDQVWGADYSGDPKTLDVHIKRLRAKIEVDPRHPRYLLTVRGVGYSIDTAQRLDRVERAS
jgi:two-component system, OmpR family, response regulator RegX3